MNIQKEFKKFGRDWFNDMVNHETRDAQKKFGFNIGTGEHASWNNEADAFKHAFLS